MFLSFALTLLTAPPESAVDFAFFEAKIRPILVSKCYGCHSAKASPPKGELLLDSKDGWLKGGARGAAAVPGKPEASLLLAAIRYADKDLQMPPSGKLPAAAIADFERWIAGGAPDPRTGPAAGRGSSPQGMSVEEGRKWWAFQPLRAEAPPATADGNWRQNPIDAFVLARLESQALTPSPPADRRTLVRRLYVDLVGYKPTYDEVEAFAADASPTAYEELVERLLASPHYGERWGRHWMDVARYGEDNPTGEATNPAYRFAWRYRDWIVEALNRDEPYDRFVKLQLAADLLPGAERADLRALGYLGAAPVYHKDLRLSEHVIGGFLADDWDERIDATTRGILALTVACARCHDHKFDPIPTRDYYGLMGVFASTQKAELPLFDVEPQVEQRFAWLQNRLFDLAYAANLLTNEASTVVGSPERVARWRAEIETLRQEAEGLRQQYPQLAANLQRFWSREQGGNSRRRRGSAEAGEFTNGVFEAAQHVDGSDPQFTIIHYRAGQARDVPLMKVGNPANPGEVVPRHFPTVLATSDPNFRQGSGRLELADKIFSDAAPLAARVIVNRVWAWHFGQPLAATPSDFGVQGARPTHPELLDDLAARFVAHRWSLKWLHRQVVTSATYRQASRPRAEGLAADADNRLLWRMNPRRLDVEVYRDTLLRVSGALDERMYGPSDDLQSLNHVRRTVYSRISRGRASALLKNYDFPDAMQSAGPRDLTVTPLQQLFVMNSQFLHVAAEEVAAAVATVGDQPQQVRALFRQALSRDATPAELDVARDYLKSGTLEQFAHVLLATNEEIFWP